MTENVQVRHASSPSLVSHSLVHNELLMYRELTKWLKECQPEIFAELMEVSEIMCFSVILFGVYY